jgi:hypothetical protein
LAIGDIRFPLVNPLVNPGMCGGVICRFTSKS